MKFVILAALAAIAIQAKADTAPAPAAGLVSVVINDEGEHLLADTKGNTLYVFDMDQNQKVPVCSSKCAEIWPPYLLTDAEVKDLKAPLGVIVRDNKSSQLTYLGRPVYAYAFDRGANADAGDGVGGVWHYVELAK